MYLNSRAHPSPQRFKPRKESDRDDSNIPCRAKVPLPRFGGNSTMCVASDIMGHGVATLSLEGSHTLMPSAGIGFAGVATLSLG